MTKVHDHDGTSHHHHHDGDHHKHDGHHHHDKNILQSVAEALHLPGFGHDHDHSLAQDQALYDNNLAIRTVILALAGLGITTILQVAIYIASGSIALLADTVHNLGDALNSVPLLVAFMFARRLPTRRYTYGFGRGEDVAGILIVASIAFSAGYILVESIDKFFNPDPIQNLGWVALAAVVGFVGNEFVALLQIRVGRKIGSDAMIADGLHARTDGLTSLAVLIAVFGVWIGLPILDPIIGIVIGLAIVGITWDASKSIWYRLMDGVNPELIRIAEATIREHEEVIDIQRLQMRWIGHRLHGEAVLQVKSEWSVQEASEFVHHLQHHFEHDLPNVGEFTIQMV